MKKLLALTAFATGYVLGAKAGRERYEQIRRIALRVKENPRVQETAHSAADKAREQAPIVGHKLADAAGTVREVVVRTLRELRRDKMIETGRHGIRIDAPEDLLAEAYPGPGSRWNTGP